MHASSSVIYPAIKSTLRGSLSASSAHWYSNFSTHLCVPSLSHSSKLGGGYRGDIWGWYCPPSTPYSCSLCHRLPRAVFGRCGRGPLAAEEGATDRGMNTTGRTTEEEATWGGWAGETSSGTARINKYTTHKYEEPTRIDASNATEEYTRSDTVQNIHYGGNYRSPESLPSASSPIALSCPRRRRCSASCMSLRWLSTTSSRPRKATAS